MRSSNVFATRVGTRVLGLFFVGAIVPVAILAFLSHRAVTRQLHEQAEHRLSQETRTARQLALERLAFSAGAVRDAVDLVEVGDSLPLSARHGVAGVLGIGVFSEGGVVARLGPVPSVSPELLDAKRPGPDVGDDVSVHVVESSDTPRVLLAVRSARIEGAMGWAEIEPDSLWAPSVTLASDPTLGNLCFITSDRMLFGCAREIDRALEEQLPGIGRDGSADGMFRFDGPDGSVWASWRQLFLRSTYEAPPWYVVAVLDEATVLTPIRGFTANFLSALLVALGLVLLLAHSLVDRTMSPLARLTDGTRSLADHDLAARVDLDADDEFGDLANAFNRMAAELQSQFHQLHAAQSIDDAVIRDRDQIGAVTALLDGLDDILDHTGAAVLLFDIGRHGSSLLFQRVGPAVEVEAHELSAEELSWVPRQPDWVSDPIRARVALEPTGLGRGVDPVYAIPMIVQAERVGVVVLGATPTQDFPAEGLVRSCRLVGRAAVALNEVRLRNELTQTSEDALKVLANAIDEKSRWTAGHSMRVTALADEIGRRMRLRRAERDILHRGGLLHDIGKIGIPLEILDFPGRLTDEMFSKIKEHPVIGARILEPMKVFQPLIPIVLHHHEKWNGTGYPHGLAGTQIPKLARVLAVADVFDAMITPRPYRDALSRDFVVSHILEGSGVAFDPDVVEAFRLVIDAGWVHEQQNAPVEATHV